MDVIEAFDLLWNICIELILSTVVEYMHSTDPIRRLAQST